MTYRLQDLNVASLDFSDIRSSLITFLQSQPELADIDFRNNTSAANLLINILSTATAYNGVYAQFGYINSFATTTTLLQSLLGLAANSSVLVEPIQSASTTRTVNAVGATLDAYTTFSATTTNGSNSFFYNLDSVPANTSASITLYAGNEVVSYTNYDYTTQSCELPYTVDPRTISFYETISGATTAVEWTRVDKSVTAETGNNTTFTVINGPQGYIVTNNFASAREITTSSSVLIQAVVSNGSAANNAILNSRSDAVFVTTPLPTGGYDLITVSEARSKLLFRATGQDRCVTINDFVNAILSSGISGTSDENDITVQNHCCIPGTVKIYVDGLSTDNQTVLMTYLGNRAVAGINLIYEL